MIVIREVYIGSRPDTITPITQVTMVDCCVYLLLIVVFMKLFTTTKYVISGVMTEDLDLGLKRPATITFKIMQKALIVME